MLETAGVHGSQKKKRRRHCIKVSWIRDLCRDKPRASLLSWGSHGSSYFSPGSSVHATILIPIPILIRIPCILPLRGTSWHSGDGNVFFVPALPHKLDLVKLKASILPTHQSTREISPETFLVYHPTCKCCICHRNYHGGHSNRTAAILTRVTTLTWCLFWKQQKVK